MPQGQPNDIEGAECLKAQGNELYRKLEYSAAHRKYTEAIELNPKNAVLYANRAAVLLALKKYSDAIWDCEKAVELDPTYARGWGRLATATQALASWEKCRYASQKALDCLPKENLSPEQRKMKTQFEQCLKKARLNENKFDGDATYASIDQFLSGKMPWQRAAALKAEKLAARVASSALVVDYAYGDFKEAMDVLTQIKVVSNSPGVQMISSTPQAIECLTNAILTDGRVFSTCMPDISDRIGRQCLIEDQYFRGWATTGGPAIVKEEAPKRLKSEGWNRLRPSLSTTVRIWILNAFFRDSLFGHHEVALELYTNALEVLKWGREQWPNVPREVRGSVFESSFIRGVKKLKLEAMHASVFRGERKYVLQELIDFAEDITTSVALELPSTVNFHLHHFLAYWMYPLATASSVIGWCLLQKALQSPEGDPERASKFEAAAQRYLAAATALPEDEEQHCRFLQKHLECLCFWNRPLRETLPLCRRIMKARDQALEMWSISPYRDMLDVTLDQVKGFHDKYQQQIMDGTCNLDSVGELPKLKRPPKPTPVVIEVRDA